MVFTDHDVREQDLWPALQVDERRIGDGIVGRDRAVAVWRRLIHSRSFTGKAVEASIPVAGRRTIAFGASAFVNTQFVRAELAHPRPGLNDRLIARIDAGEPVILSDAQVRAANSSGTLCLA